MVLATNITNASRRNVATSDTAREHVRVFSMGCGRCAKHPPLQTNQNVNARTVASGWSGCNDY